MSFIPHSKTEWIQQTRLAIFVLALFGCLLFLIEGLDTGLGVYRKPTFCWVAAAFALVAFVVATRSQRWIALATFVIGVLGSVYGYHENAVWREKLKQLKPQESAYVHAIKAVL